MATIDERVAAIDERVATIDERVAAIDEQVAASTRRISALEEAQELSSSAARLVRASSSGSSADTLAALQVGAGAHVVSNGRHCLACHGMSRGGLSSSKCSAGVNCTPCRSCAACHHLHGTTRCTP